MLFLVVARRKIEAFCSRPLSGSRTATIGIGRVAGFGVAGRRFFRLAVVLVLRWSWPR